MKDSVEKHRRGKRRTSLVWTAVTLYMIGATLVALATQANLAGIGLFVFRASVIPYIAITWWAGITIVDGLNFSTEENSKDWTLTDIIGVLLLIAVCAAWLLYGTVAIVSLLDSL